MSRARSNGGTGTSRALLVLYCAAVISILTVQIVNASVAQQAVDWSYPNANASGTNHVEQSQIGPGNFGSVALKWVYPFEASTPVAGLFSVGQGAIAPPLLVHGVVYVAMNSLRVLALNAADGSLLWSYIPTLNTSGLPLSRLIGHVHGLTYYRNEVWMSLPDCSVVALKAETGAVALRLSSICAGIPGNAGKYDYSGSPVTFYRDVMIWTASSVTEGTDAGRGFVAGYNITDGRLLWRWFAVPPAGGNQSWDSDSCTVPCVGNVTPVAGDWGIMGMVNGSTRAGASASWGQPAVDPRLGVVYVGTSQPSPDWNATNRPGPNLYSDSVVALNAISGKMLWFFQTTPHDLYDFDCGWNTALGNITSGGSERETVFKGCKNGYVYALDAKTGSLLWYFDPPSVRRVNTSNADYVSTEKYNGTLPWLNFPSVKPFVQCPGENGGVESDISVAYNHVFVATHNFCTVGSISNVSNIGGGIWGAVGLSPDRVHANTTIYALNQSTGRVSWSYFVPGVPYRGWLTATGGMLLASTLSGDMLALDASSGRLVGKLHLGASLYEGVTLGTDVDGSITLLQLLSASSYGGFGGGVPGALLAFGLAENVSVAWPDLAPWVLTVVLAAAVAILAWRERGRRPQGQARPGP